MTKMKELPLNERPIEKLLDKGSEKLSNEELLAIVLATGSKGTSAKDLALKLLVEVGGIENLKDINLASLLKIKGIGNKKAATLLALIELSKRMSDIPFGFGMKLTNSEDVYKHFYPKFKDELQEYFYCIYLDTSKKIIEEKLLFKGTLNQSLVHPREVFRLAYLNGAASIIFIHNHPSGDSTPSRNDIELTRRMIRISKVHDIKIDDHIIIGKGNYFSFYEANIMEEL